MSGPRLWLSAGEPSGDAHGAALLRALARQAPGTTFTGMGGPQMCAAGLESKAYGAPLAMERLSVMGVTEVLAKLPGILRLIREYKRRLRVERPDAVVVIDAPDFHFRVIPAAKALGIPVFYYISPKIWASREKRVRFIQRHVDKMLCILPFEQAFYARHGVDVAYVGNPLMDDFDFERLDRVLPTPNRVCLLPGSRRREVETLMPLFAATAERLTDLELDYFLPLAPTVREEQVRAHWPERLPLTVHPTEERPAFYEQVRSAWIAWAASGTVTLETALLGAPTLVAYRLSAVTAALYRRFIRVPYVSLPNLIMGREVFPELLQDMATPETLAMSARAWLEHPDVLRGVREGLAPLREMMGEPGASDRAATLILEDLPGSAVGTTGR